MRLGEEFWGHYNSFLTGARYQSEYRPFKEYIEWLNSNENNVSPQYWIEYLRGFDGLTGIPKINLDSGNTKSLAKLTHHIDEHTASQLFDIGRRISVTNFSVIQSLWGILLGVYNDCSDVVFGTVASGRPPDLDGVDKMIGPFINAIPVRIQFDKFTRFSDLIKEVHARSWECQRYQHLSLTDLVVKDGLQKNIFDHLMVFQNYLSGNKSSSAYSGVTNIVFKNSIERTNYDINVVVGYDRNLSLRINFNEHQYSRSFIKRLTVHFDTLIHCVVADPEVLVSRLSILAEEETKTIKDFGSAINLRRNKQNLIKHFKEQVRQKPDSIAVTFMDISLTYQQLDSLSDSFAHFLSKNFKLNNPLVGIVLKKSEHVIISILAIIKIGKAYLPIDSKLPYKRKMDILRDSHAELLLIDSAYVLDFPGFKYDVVVVDEALTRLTNSRFLCVENESLAYAVYTSGSSGKPKGVLIEQEAIIALIKQQPLFEMAKDSRMAQLSSFSFDAFTFEIMGTIIERRYNVFILR